MACQLTHYIGINGLSTEDDMQSRLVKFAQASSHLRERAVMPDWFILSRDTKCSFANYKPAAVLSFNQVNYLHPENSVELWKSHTEMHFLD